MHLTVHWNWISEVNNLSDKKDLPILMLSVKKESGFEKAGLENKLKQIQGISSVKTIFIFNERVFMFNIFKRWIIYNLRIENTTL